MAKRADLGDPLVQFAISALTLLLGSVISYLVQGGGAFRVTDALMGLTLALSVQIAFLVYEIGGIKKYLRDLFPFVSEPVPTRNYSPMMLLRSIPGLDDDLLSLTVADTSKGRVWLDILRHADALDASCHLEPTCWWLTNDGDVALNIQRQRIASRELRVRRLFILRSQDKTHAYLAHLKAQASMGVEVRWVNADDPRVVSWMEEMSRTIGSPDISLFTVRNQKLLYTVQLGDNNTIVAGNYRTDGSRRAESLFEDLFKGGRSIAELKLLNVSGSATPNNTALAADVRRRH